MNLPADRRNWEPFWYELYTERASIMAVDAHMPIWKAEKEAEADIRKVAAETNDFT
jgi:hypothetical protein